MSVVDEIDAREPEMRRGGQQMAIARVDVTETMLRGCMAERTRLSVLWVQACNLDGWKLVESAEGRGHFHDGILASLGGRAVGGAARGGDFHPEAALVGVDDLEGSGFADDGEVVFAAVGFPEVAGAGLAGLFAHDLFRRDSRGESLATLRTAAL